MSTTVGLCPQRWGYVHNGGGMSTTVGLCPQRWGYVHNGRGYSTTVWGIPQQWGVFQSSGGYSTTVGGIPQHCGYSTTLWVFHNRGGMSQMCLNHYTPSVADIDQNNKPTFKVLQSCISSSGNTSSSNLCLGMSITVGKCPQQWGGGLCPQQLGLCPQRWGSMSTTVGEYVHNSGAMSTTVGVFNNGRAMSTTVGLCLQWWGVFHNSGGYSTTVGGIPQQWGYSTTVWVFHNSVGITQPWGYVPNVLKSLYPICCRHRSKQ